METNNNEGILPPDIMEKMFTDRKVRGAITQKSHFLFFHFYFAHYVKYRTARFQRELFSLTEQKENLFVVAFRGSAKSTIFTMSYPLWAILGVQQKKFVLIICQTQAQAKQHMMNLRRELEGNQLLKNDLGPFQEESSEWGSFSLVFSKLGARITAVSTEQSIRGLRHNQHRPDLVIGDDLEDLASTKTRESRNKTHQWFTAEVIPAGDRNTRVIVIGNLLHEDSLLMRLREDIETRRVDGIFKSYPLVNDGEIAWPGKYPSITDIEDERRKAANEFAWQREYLLHIVPAEGQAILPEWIHYYDKLPSKEETDCFGYPKTTEVRISVDMAISQKETADYTAIVVALVVGSGKDLMVYILPNPINERMNFPETVERCKALNIAHSKGGTHPTFILEDVAYQKSLPQQLEHEGIRNVKTIRPGSQDKRTRLVLTAHMIKNGKILFPRDGSKELISQIIHFGVEKHDDLADAFSSLILSVIDSPPSSPRIFLI